MVPKGYWPGVIQRAEVKVSRSGTKYIQVLISTQHGDVWLNLLPWHEAVRWRYKAELQALGVDLELYFEWDGVDLSEQMAEALTFILPDRWCYVYVKHVEFRGLKRAQATLV
jgi:hypothetical protein